MLEAACAVQLSTSAALLSMSSTTDGAAGPHSNGVGREPTSDGPISMDTSPDGAQAGGHAGVSEPVRSGPAQPRPAAADPAHSCHAPTNARRPPGHQLGKRPPLGEELAKQFHDASFCVIEPAPTTEGQVRQLLTACCKIANEAGSTAICARKMHFDLVIACTGRGGGAAVDRLLHKQSITVVDGKEFTICRFHVGRPRSSLVVLDTDASCDLVMDVAEAIIAAAHGTELETVSPAQFVSQFAMKRLEDKNAVYVTLPTEGLKAIVLGLGSVIVNHCLCRIVDPSADNRRPTAPASAPNTERGAPPSSHRSAWKQPANSSAPHMKASPSVDHNATAALRDEIESLKRALAVQEARFGQLELELEQTRRHSEAVMLKMSAMGDDMAAGFWSLTEMVGRLQGEPMLGQSGGSGRSAALPTTDKRGAIPAPTTARNIFPNQRGGEDAPTAPTVSAPPTASKGPKGGFFTKRHTATKSVNGNATKTSQPTTSGTTRGRENTPPASPIKPPPSKVQRIAPPQLEPLGSALLMQSNGDTTADGAMMCDKHYQVDVYSCGDGYYIECDEAVDEIFRCADAAGGERAHDAGTRSQKGYHLRSLGVSSFVCSHGLCLGDPEDGGSISCPYDTQLIGFNEDSAETDTGLRLFLDEPKVRRTIAQYVASAVRPP